MNPNSGNGNGNGMGNAYAYGKGPTSEIFVNPPNFESEWYKTSFLIPHEPMR